MTPTARSRALRHNRVLKTVSPPSPPLDLYPDFGFLLTLRGALSKAAILLKPQVLVWYSFSATSLRGFPTLPVSSLTSLLTSFSSQRVPAPLSLDPLSSLLLPGQYPLLWSLCPSAASALLSTTPASPACACSSVDRLPTSDPEGDFRVSS